MGDQKGEGEGEKQRKVDPKPLQPYVDVIPVCAGQCFGVVKHSGVVALPDRFRNMWGLVGGQVKNITAPLGCQGDLAFTACAAEGAGESCSCPPWSLLAFWAGHRAKQLPAAYRARYSSVGSGQNGARITGAAHPAGLDKMRRDYGY